MTRNPTIPITPPTPVTVLGGTGKTGRRVVARLRSAGRPVRVASRRSELRFDWHDPAGWDAAVSGAGAVYVVPDDTDPGDRMAAFADRAVRAGVERLVLLSAREWADLDDPAAMAREEAVRASEAAWTILRPTWFAQGFSEDYLAREVAAGEVRIATGDGRHPFIDTEDIAAVAVAALTDRGHGGTGENEGPGKHDGKVYELSGPRALAVDEALAEISRVAGRPLRRIPVGREEYRHHLAEAHGFDAGTIEVILTLTDLIRRGADARLSDGVQRVLGRPPRDFAAYAADAFAAGDHAASGGASTGG